MLAIKDKVREMLRAQRTDQAWDYISKELEKVLIISGDIQDDDTKWQRGRGSASFRFTRPTAEWKAQSTSPLSNKQSLPGTTTRHHRIAATLSQWSDRLRIIWKNGRIEPDHRHTTQHLSTFNALNCQAKDALAKELNPDDKHERELILNLESFNGQHQKHFLRLRAEAAWHTKQYNELATKQLSEAKGKAREQQRTEMGHRSTYKLLRGGDAPPLFQAMRTAPGPQGQPTGTITTNPDEVDAIVIATLQKVCDGNAEDHTSLVTNFIDKHREDIFHADEFAMEDIDAVSFQNFCTQGADSAGGLDHWTPADFKVFSPQTFVLLTDLLNTIERGASWPKALQTAKAAFLAKDEDKSHDPLAHRILLILSTLYRKWAGYRQRELKPWIQKWANEHTFAGVPGLSAQDAWYSTSLDVERHFVTSTTSPVVPLTSTSVSIRSFPSWPTLCWLLPGCPNEF